jgi:hypothetical protein
MLLVLVMFLAAGCAGTAGSVRPLTAAPKPDVIGSYTKALFETSAQGEASKMTDGDRDRITALVVQKVKDKSPNRFAEFTTTADDRTLCVKINFTRYDEGNAFARYMLAGLGQMHIDAEVRLQDCVRQVVLAKSEVTKTFAWGGMYGGFTGIKDLEGGFAEAVAQVLLGQASQ